MGNSRHEEKVERLLSVNHRIRSYLGSPQFKGLDRFRTFSPRLGGWSRLFWQRAVRPFGGAVARGGALDGDAASMDGTATETVDTRMMRRCLELSRAAGKAGELPFAAMICRDDVVISETTNQVTRDGDVTRHAEILAISQAQRATGNTNLQGCTLYTIVEPCPMCSFPVRETRISRVVYAISSPVMGGASRWNVLGDSDLSKRMPEAFGAPPEVVSGVLSKEAASVWRKWNPIVWGVIRLRGVFGPP
ncbi:MAG: nucleoside deaminase [Rhodoplanes sp.]